MNEEKKHVLSALHAEPPPLLLWCAGPLDIGYQSNSSTSLLSTRERGVSGSKQQDDLGVLPG